MYLLIPILLAGLAAVVGRVYRPFGGAPEGVPICRVGLPPAARLRLHATTLAGFGLLLTLGTAAGWLDAVLAAAAAAAAVVVTLAMPTAYTVTDQGIALGRTPVRRWTEFSGIGVRGGRLRLQAIAGHRGMDVWLGRPSPDGDLAAELRRLVRGSYKGDVVPGGATDAAARTAAVRFGEPT